ncbi:hypothetical protein BJV82DRAFT_590367 [Fennellomyces sp. T-0311]|nr:hypothetical protein BJV82DRAFT_590367 [Fennellomyces sp. T-0311]
MVEYTEAQIEVIKAIADTVVGPLSTQDEASLINNAIGTSSEAVSAYARYSGGSDYQAVIRTLQQLSPHKQQELQTILNVLASPVGTFALTRHYQKFSALSRQEREAVFLSWKSSILPPLVTLYGTFAGLTCTALYRNPECPAYKAIGYQDRDPVRSQPDYQPPNVTERLPMLTVKDIENLARLDAIIIGSGAGGGVCAAELAQAGQSVLVIEKGVYYHESEFQWGEQDGLNNLLERGGLLVSENGTTQVYCASTIGGGTTVNWSMSLKPQHFVREEWAKRFGLSHFKSPQFSRDLDRVYERIGASTAGIQHSRPNQILIEGCQKLGYHVSDVPQNTGGKTHDCNHCFYGCRDGTKNGTMNSWLRDAHAAGAKMVDRTKVLRVLIENGRAVGVECVVHGEKRVKIYANRVVVSAGSMNTPGILLQSGLKNKNIGRHLRLHPCVFIYGVFDEPVDMNRGSIMTTVTNVAESVNKDGYGAKIEVPSSHMGLYSAVSVWRGAAKHKEFMLKYRYAAPLVVICRDKDSVGYVKYNDEGEVIFDYSLSRGDRRSLVAGIYRSVTIMAAAGAREIYTAQIGIEPFVFNKDEEIRADNPRFIAWREKVVKYGLPDSGVNAFGSAHQMGSCRLGVSPRNSATKPTGETWDVKNLYVADASLFPSPSGVNPMVTIEACALMVAANIIKSTKATASL